MGRPRDFDHATLAPKLIQARRNNVPWKIIRRIYGVSRVQGWRIIKKFGGGKDVSKHPRPRQGASLSLIDGR